MVSPNYTYYFITSKGNDADLSSNELFLEEKAILEYLGKVSIPCSIFNIKMKIEESDIKRSHQFIEKVLLTLKEKGLVGVRE